MRVGCRLLIAVVLLVAGGVVSGGSQTAHTRYRVEQIFRLETTSARPQPLPGRLRAEPVNTAVEGRVRLLLEQSPAGVPGQGSWRFLEVEVDGPRADPPEAENPGAARALALGLAWMKQLDGQEFSGPLAELPVLPLGEAPPAWLAEWLRWAQTGSYAGVEGSPVALPAVSAHDPGSEEPATAYEVRWLRAEFRQQPCQVQQARWAVPVQPAPGSVPADLAAEGVEARTHFSALSLEWVSTDGPALIYAERSGVRETFWNLEKVRKPELRQLVFRLRFAVQVRVERLPQRTADNP